MALTATLHAAIVVFAAGFALGQAAGLGTFGAAIAAIVLASLPQLAVRRIAARLPPDIDDAFTHRRRAFALWAALALLSLVQTGRLSAFMIDSSRAWGAAIPGKNATHNCVAAYVRAAELSRADAPNLYDHGHYRELGAPALHTELDNLAAHLSDPFQYPPPFLLLPRAAIALSDDFYVIRPVWFALQAVFFGVVAMLVARRTGADERLSGWLIPAVWSSLPTLVSFQYGQAHLVVLAAAMAAMLAFERERLWLGGALLAAAVWAKLFPGILIVVLVVQRRWRAVGATVACMSLAAAIGWVVLGSAPFSAFATYHLPRMASGEAFAFYLDSPVTIADNQSIQGLPHKLEALGIGVRAATAAAALRWLYAGFVVALAIVVARRPDRDEPCAWLALLGLGAFVSPYAPGSYVLAGTIWLFALVSRRAMQLRHGTVGLILAWLFVQTVPFMSDMPVLWRHKPLILVASIAAQLVAVAVAVWAATHARRPGS